MKRRIATLSIALLGALTSAPAAAEPEVLVPGYTIALVSAGVPDGAIAQLAFRPGDPHHLYAVHVDGRVVRYDYAADGGLSSALTLASGLGQALGLAFHGGDLFVSMDLGGSLVQRPGDGRITRLSDPDENGVYLRRHDFVHSIDKGAHDVNQIQVRGHTLFVGIGAAGRTGDPEQENVYTMSVARIADLRQVDFSVPLDADFKGPVNWLADETAWTDLAAADGLLRYHASGFRNPFGIALDLDGELWVSSNGNSDPGFLSPDYLYRELAAGAQGAFPPPEFGYGPPLVTGVPTAPFLDLGQNPSPTGLDFVPAGPDQGKVVLAQAGATDQLNHPVGKDVLLIDPDTGHTEVLVDGFELPTDVVRDPYDRLLIADLGAGSIWLLTPPAAPSPAGAVPDGPADGDAPLRLDRSGEGLILAWSGSCHPGDVDYHVYEGRLGEFYSHRSQACSTAGATTIQLEPASGDRYYLVAPANTSYEGSLGRASTGAERPVGRQACLPRGIAVDCR